MKMKAEIKELQSRAQTGRAIYSSAKHFNDLGMHLDDSLQGFFNYVKNIPYLEDTTKAEIVSRPKYMLGKGAFKNGIDCKKKAVLMASWLEAHGIPYRLVAVSERKNKQIHHVFPQAKINGKWLNVDATYNHYKLFEGKPKVTHGEVLSR